MTMITKILKRRRYSMEKKNGQSVGSCVVLNWYLLGVKMFGSHAHLISNFRRALPSFLLGSPPRGVCVLPQILNLASSIE